MYKIEIYTQKCALSHILKSNLLKKISTKILGSNSVGKNYMWTKRDILIIQGEYFKQNDGFKIDILVSFLEIC